MGGGLPCLVGQLLAATSILSLWDLSNICQTLATDLSDGNEELIEGHGGIHGNLPGNRIRLHHLGLGYLVLFSTILAKSFPVDRYLILL